MPKVKQDNIVKVVKVLKVEATAQDDGQTMVRLKLNDFAWQCVPNLPESVLQSLADVYKEVFDHARKANRKTSG